jgi:ABC-2 type transport system permease protein
VGNVDTPGVIGSYIGLALLSGVFCSVGMVASSITSNQIVAFIVAAFLCFILFTGFESIAMLNVWSANALLIKQFGILYHYDALSKGLIDSRDVVYFVCMGAFMLMVSKTVLSARSW